MDRRVPAAGDGDHVAVDPPGRAGDRLAARVEGDHVDGANPPAAMGADHRPAIQHFDSPRQGFLPRRPGTIGPDVDDGDDPDPGVGKIERRPMAVVVVGEHHDLASGADAEAVDVGADGAGQHHPRPVVVGEHQRPLDRAGGQHHPAGAHLPQPFAGAGPGSRRTGVAPFEQAEIVVIVIAERRRPRQKANLFQRREFLCRVFHPRHRRRVVDRHPLAEQPAAELGILVGEDHPRAGAPGGQRRRQPGRSAADHQHIAVGVHLVVGIGIGLVRRGAEAGGAADDPLVSHPQAGRPHERLVVEAGGEKRREPLGDGAGIEIDARPAVDAGRPQPVVEIDDGGRQVGLGVGAGFQLHQGVGLLDAGGEDAARAVILEAAADHGDVVGEQRRGQGVPRMALVAAAVEGERQRPVAVDAAPGGEAVVPAHAPSSTGGFPPMR